MVCVTTCILGFMFLLGWELGTIESVSATVLVGLSVDYVVHLAQVRCVLSACCVPLLFVGCLPA